jgi:hypothetical protein
MYGRMIIEGADGSHGRTVIAPNPRDIQAQQESTLECELCSAGVIHSDCELSRVMADDPEGMDDVVCLPNTSRAAFCQLILRLAARFELDYSPADDELFHCCEAIAIGLFMDGEHPDRHMALRTFLNARGVVRFRGE